MGLTTHGLVNDGETTYFKIAYDSALPDEQGKSLAQGLMNVCDADYALLAHWFAGTEFKFSLPVNIEIENATGGGEWNDPSGIENTFGYHPTVKIKAAGGPGASGLALVRYLLVGEVSEMFMASKDNGWYVAATAFHGGDEGSKGEGLSRFLADQLALRLGVTAGFTGYDAVDLWLNTSPRENFVDRDPVDHGRDAVVGCTTCFLFYLHDQLGHEIPDIINAGSATLGGVYQKLTGRTDGWQSFIDTVNLHYPTDTTYVVPADNIFPVAGLHWLDNTTRLTAGALGGVFVSLDRTTPADVELTLVSDDPAVLEIPASRTIPAGSIDYSLPVKAQDVTGPERSVAIHVTYAGKTLSAPVLILPRTSVLTGLVRDAATGTGLANAVVLVDDGDPAGHEHMQLSTGSDGSYTTPPLPPNTYHLEASASGYVTATADAVVGAGVPTTAHDFALVATLPFTLHGVVSDSLGAAVPGASLTLEKNGDDYERFDALSDDEGLYSVTVDPGAFAGDYTLVADHPGYVEARTDFTTPNGQNVRRDLVLPQLGTVAGLITDGHRPVVDAAVRAGALVVSSDATGRYGLQPPPGPIAVTVIAKGFEAATATVTVVPGGSVDHDFVLAAATARLSGTVFDYDEGGPFPGAVVSAGGAPAAARSDDDGRYTVTGIPTGPTTVTVTAHGKQTQAWPYVFTAGQALSSDFQMARPGPRGDPGP